MDIIIAGGTGFIGHYLVPYFLRQKKSIAVIGRDKQKIEKCFGSNVTAINWDELTLELIKNASAIINLTGENVGDKPWTEARKREILTSRTKPTKQLAALCAQLGSSAPTLLNAGGIGIYGTQVQVPNGLPQALDESSPLPENHLDFMTIVGVEWERATQQAQESGVRVVNFRFGVVLGKGGALKKIALPFYFGIGGRIGSGDQPMSWVAIDDLAKAIDFCIHTATLSGPVNIVAPECVAQKIFARTLGKVLRRPSFMPTPAWALTLVFGEMAKVLLLNGQHVKPTRLLAAGFEFDYPNLDLALRHVLSSG